MAVISFKVLSLHVYLPLFSRVYVRGKAREKYLSFLSMPFKADHRGIFTNKNMKEWCVFANVTHTMNDV